MLPSSFVRFCLLTSALSLLSLPAVASAKHLKPKPTSHQMAAAKRECKSAMKDQGMKTSKAYSYCLKHWRNYL